MSSGRILLASLLLLLLLQTRKAATDVLDPTTGTFHTAFDQLVVFGKFRRSVRERGREVLRRRGRDLIESRRRSFEVMVLFFDSARLFLHRQGEFPQRPCGLSHFAAILLPHGVRGRRMA